MDSGPRNVENRPPTHLFQCDSAKNRMTKTQVLYLALLSALGRALGVMVSEKNNTHAMGKRETLEKQT